MLENFSDSGVYLLSSLEKKTRFVYSVCNTTSFVDFENIVNVGTLQSIREGSVSSEITKINKLCKIREK